MESSKENNNNNNNNNNNENNNNNNHFPIQDLPRDVLTNIFSFLSEKEARRVREVNKKFNAAANKLFQIKKNKTLSYDKILVEIASSHEGTNLLNKLCDQLLLDLLKPYKSCSLNREKNQVLVKYQPAEINLFKDLHDEFPNLRKFQNKKVQRRITLLKKVINKLTEREKYLNGLKKISLINDPNILKFNYKDLKSIFKKELCELIAYQHLSLEERRKLVMDYLTETAYQIFKFYLKSYITIKVASKLFYDTNQNWIGLPYLKKNNGQTQLEDEYDLTEIMKKATEAFYSDLFGNSHPWQNINLENQGDCHADLTHDPLYQLYSKYDWKKIEEVNLFNIIHFEPTKKLLAEKLLKLYPDGLSHKELESYKAFSNKKK